MDKQIPLGELAQLKKLMAMTTSTNDNEALAFMRKANAILLKYGLTWTGVLSRTVSAIDTGPEPSQDERTLHEEIQMAFDEIRGNTHGDFASFVESIEKQFKDKGYLSPAQRKPLYDAVRRHRERRNRDA